MKETNEEFNLRCQKEFYELQQIVYQTIKHITQLCQVELVR